MGGGSYATDASDAKLTASRLTRVHEATTLSVARVDSPEHRRQGDAASSRA
jgi:hypothetical protein